MLEYYEIMKRVWDVKTNKTICVIETFPLITENVPSDKSIFIKSSAKARSAKLAPKNFPSFCENHPIFWVRNAAY